MLFLRSISCDLTQQLLLSVRSPLAPDTPPGLSGTLLDFAKGEPSTSHALMAFASLARAPVTMLTGQSCPMLPATAISAMRQRLCSPVPLPQQPWASVATLVPLLDWRQPLMRRLEHPSAVASPDQAVQAHPAAFEALGLDRRVTVRLRSCLATLTAR